MELQIRQKINGGASKNLYLEDCAMVCLAVVMLAFGDYRTLNIVVQVVSFCVILVGHLRRNNHRVSSSAACYAAFKCVFLLWCFLSCIWSINAEHSFAQSVTVGLRLMTGLAIILYVDSYDRLEKLLRYIVFACCILCLRLLVAVPLTAWGSDRVGNYLAHDKSSSYGNTGVTYVLGVAGIYLLVFERLFSKQIRWPLFVMFAVVSVLSGSKKEIGILAIAIIAFALLRSKNITSMFKNFVIATVAVAIMLCAVFYIQPLYDVLGERSISFLSYFHDGLGGIVDDSTMDRSAFIGYALDVFASSPMFGVGIDCFRYLNPISTVWSECNFVELLADAGLIGFLLYYVFVFWILKKSSLVVSETSKASTVLLLVMLFIDFSMVTYASNTLQFHWAVLWAIVCLSASRQAPPACQKNSV